MTSPDLRGLPDVSNDPYPNSTVNVGPVHCPACKRPYVTTLTEDEQEVVDRLRDKLGLMRIAERQAAEHDDRHADDAANDLWSSLTNDMAFWLPLLLAIIDRLSAAPVDDREPSVTYTSTATRPTTAVDDDRDRVPEGWRVEWIECRHYRPEESHPVPRLIEIVPSCEGHRRLVPVFPSVDPEEKPDA